MSRREWFGFTKPRDAPETELPMIEDNVRDSGGVFVFGQALSGERVDEKYGSAFFKNGAQPAGVLEHPGVLKDPQKIRDNWMNAYGGAGNAHKVAVLEEGVRPDGCH